MSDHVHACSITHCTKLRNGCLCACGVSYRDGHWLTSDELADFLELTQTREQNKKPV